MTYESKLNKLKENIYKDQVEFKKNMSTLEKHGIDELKLESLRNRRNALIKHLFRINRTYIQIKNKSIMSLGEFLEYQINSDVIRIGITCEIFKLRIAIAKKELKLQKN